MPLMRDQETGVEREVHDRYLARFPDEYEAVEPVKSERPVKVRLVGAEGAHAYLKAAATAPKKRPSKKSTATPAVGATETPQGEE